jgi:hypothetical protein
MVKAETRKIITIRLSPKQFILAKRKMLEQSHSWQYLCNRAINDYIMGAWHPEAGTGAGENVVLEDYRGADVLDIDAMENLAHDWIGTRELRSYIIQQTGRHVSMEMLRALLREQFPQPERHRYIWRGTADPEVAAIVSEIERGALSELLERRLEGAKTTKRHAPNKGRKTKNRSR